MLSKIPTASRPKVCAPRAVADRKALGTPAALSKEAVACGIAVCLSVSAADVAQAYNPVASVAQQNVNERVIKGEGPGLGSYVQEDIEGPLKPPGKMTVERAEKEGVDAVKNVVGASGVKTFESGPDIAKPSEDLQPSDFFDTVARKIEETKKNIIGQ